MGNIDDDIRRTSLRIDENLAVEVDRLASIDNRSFNNELIVIIKKGINLVETEKNLIMSFDPLYIINTYGPSKHD